MTQKHILLLSDENIRPAEQVICYSPVPLTTSQLLVFPALLQEGISRMSWVQKYMDLVHKITKIFATDKIVSLFFEVANPGI